MEAYQIRALSFTYPLREKPALKKINLTVKQGEFITVCGKSGSGKSTLLRHLKTVLTPHGNNSG
jgi:ABC-type bacteriocin/lantibiotic exporter with double-glycine peptidase domain